MINWILNLVSLPYQLYSDVRKENQRNQKSGDGIGRSNVAICLLLLVIGGMVLWYYSAIIGFSVLLTSILTLFLNRDSLLLIIRLAILAALSIFLAYLGSFFGVYKPGGSAFIVVATLTFAPLYVFGNSILEDRIG
jgi:hypothetical protein